MSALSDYLDKYIEAPYIPEGPAPGISTSDDNQSQDSGSPGLFDKISAFLSNAGQAYGNADNPGAEVYSQTPYADNLTNEVHDQNMADGQNIYTVLAPNYTPRPLDDSVYTDIPGTPVDLGTLEDESVRNARMQDSADYMAANWPRLYGAGAGAVENGANVVGGIQNALGLGDSTLQNAEQFEKGMQDYRKQWDATYGDNYFLNPNNFANDAGAVIGSTAPILALSAMTPGALVTGGSRALTGALSRAGLGRLAMSKAGQALIADTVRTLPSSSLADSLSEYGGVVHDLMQNGMSEDEARAQAVPIFYKNMALDTAVLPLELGIAKGGKGLITGLLKRNAGEGVGKGLAKGTARTGILSGLSGITEGYQEGAQNALENQTKGERDGGWYNPVTWTPEDWRSARAGFVGGALMGIPGNVATAYRPDTKQADLSPEAQTQVQDIKNTLMNDASYGNMDSDTYNSYLELANSGNPALIKLANDSLASWKEKQGISTDSTVSTDMTAGEDQTGPVNAEMEAEKDRIRQYLNDNTIEQMGGQKNYDWLYNTLNSTDPDEVHKAYQTAVESTAETQEQEADQAEQQGEEQPTGNVSINSDNPYIGYVVQAANDQGIDPKIALAIAARETGGDDVNAINMAPNGGLMQITEISAGDYGVNDLYPDWRSDPEQNAEAGMYILKKKIEEAGGDTWAGVRGYNGAGEAADQYLNQIQQNYDNLGDIGGSSWSGGVSGYDLPTQSDEITAQVETLKPEWKQALPAIGGILNDMGLADGSAISSAGRTSAHNAEVGGAEHSYHINDDERGGGDAVDIVLPEGTTEEQAQAVLDRFKSTGAFKEVLFHDAGSGYHLHLGGYTGGLSGRTGNADSDMSDIRRQQDAEDRAFDEQEREINDDSRAAMNRIMNDNSVENAFDETQRDTEAAKKQQEETLKALTNDTQEEQPAQTPETAQNQPQNGLDTTVDATTPIGQQTAITGANTATKTVQQNQLVQTAQAQPIQTPAGTQDPRINKAIHDPAMLNLVTRAMNGDSVAKESVGNLNQNIVDAVQQHIIATALNAHQQRIAKAPAGKTETILSDDVKTEYPAQYKIVSADDITPSNNTDGSVNAFYPQQYQPRDRTRAGMRKQVEDMANNLNPSALGTSSNANMGAPVINSQGVVLNGNGRTMALKSVYKGKPKQIKAYKDFLKQNAKSLGIDPATIDGVKNPVLVRQVADDAPVQDIINSKAGGSQMSAGETAKKDADRIKQSTLQLASDSGDLTQESNRKFVNAVLKDVASPEELNTLYTKTGKISQAGITRVKNAVFAKAYGDDYLLTKMSESTDNNIRNVMNAMLTVAPKVAMLNDGMVKGLFYSYPLSDVISGSAKTLIGLREQNKPVKFYLEETSLISESENQDSINDVLQFIDRNKRSGKTITAFFNEMCNEIELQGHPGQSALIASENPTMEEVINIAERKVENNGVQSLFDTGRSEGNQKDTASGRMADGVLPGTSAGTETNAGANGSERKEESTGKTESRPEVAKGEANEENTESNHVNTEPQQTESKNTESTHAEEGSQGDVQEEISKFHNVLDDEKSTPKQIVRAYQSIVDKVITNANGNSENAKIGDKIVTDEYRTLTDSPRRNTFDGYWHEAAIINAEAHKKLRAIIKTAGVKAKEAPPSQGIAPYKQAVDDIMDKLAHKKLTPTQAINKLKTIIKDANAARWGQFDAMESIKSNEKLSFDGYTAASNLANDAISKVNDIRLEATQKRKEHQRLAEQPKEDIRFGPIEEAEKAVMEAFGVKEHKKPELKKPTIGTPITQKRKILPQETTTKTFKFVDDSDKALEDAKKAFLNELNNISANPLFNPNLIYYGLKIGAIHIQRGMNTFADWVTGMKETLPQSEPFLTSIWDALKTMPDDVKFDEKKLTAAIRYVGSMYDHGITDKVDLRKRFIATLGVRNAKYFESVYNAVIKYPSAEELKGVMNHVNSNISELAPRIGEGASENAVGEGRIQGRTAVRRSRQDTAPAGKESPKQGMGHDSVPGGSSVTGRTTGNSRVQTQESKDSTGSTGSIELSGSARAGLERIPDDDKRRPDELVRAAQNRPQHEDPVEKAQKEQKDKHLDEIKKALPMLLPQQAEDVCIAETRFKDHSGMMFTNGTGTGKTYTGLGVVKRFVDAGKKDILVIAPSDGILKQWEEAAAKDFGITLTRLNSTKDAGEGAVTATYANVGANRALVNRDFDLVITDESHNLMGSESAKPTEALQLVRAVTGNKDGFVRYHHDKHLEISSKIDKALEEIKKLRKRDSQIGKARQETRDPELDDESRKISDKIEELEEDVSKWHEKLEAFNSTDEKAFAKKRPSKVLFLSATPFQYVSDLDYANGYLFDYADYGPMEQQGYNQANGRENFYMENFGYKMRYNRLEKPGADVDTDLMEREFNRKMVESGAMHGRMLSSSYDYDRGFIRIDAGVGEKIDKGFEWLRNQPKYSELSNFLRMRFKGQQKYYLLEAIKAKQAIPLIKEYINSGKKVVVFHNFNKGGADNPFVISREGMDHLERLSGELANHIFEQYHEFQTERPDLIGLDLNSLESPIKTLSKAFGDELALYNGILSKSDREKNKKAFNDDDSKVKVILVQSAAGQAGVSLHDTTGKHQRVLINLGLPTRPSEAIQQEGRIYRVGNKSNAIFRYLNTGTYMEQTAFATKLAERAGTVENIALGEMARSLKQAYVEAFEESQEGDEWKKYLPGSKTEGTGGKDNDYRQEKTTDFDRAKAVYFGKQKKNSRTKSREGVDYFATPEPIGYKMVQWLQAKPGQSLLEPSAGDGAIARWMPDNTYNTVVEPSRDLTPKLMRNVAGAKVVESTFENFDLHNKFDGIAMNPPFGHGGKTAVEHVAKAYQHLKDGGRLIAIIPDGSACQKHFDKWFYGNPEAKRKEDRGVADGVLMADIRLPSVTFNRAGTSVNTRMVVIDKYTDEGARQIAGAESKGRIDIAADDVSELFDRIEDMNMPDRLDMSDEKKQASIRKVGQQLYRSKEDLKAEIKEAFPNAKEIKDEGDRMTFTMPNGSHIIVDMKNEIVLTDKDLAQAKKDHHIDDNGNVVVEGYAEVRGKDAYMALAQGSREGTGFHEAYHIAEDAVLTDREKAAIKKAIPDAEERADKYAEWVEARKHGRGTAWGKLFQKIKDFAMKMKAIFTGAENVHNVFRKIESGEAWERNANGQNSGRRYSVANDEQQTVKPQDIITAINDIVHIYEGSKLTAKEREELKKASKFDPDHKQADRPQATELYDRRAKAGFNRMGYFNMSNYGRILALHLDNVMGLKGNLELTRKSIERQNKNAAEAKLNGVKEEKLSPSQARQRAVMDFGAMMIRNPELARETYPEYAKIFDEGLSNHPDLKEKLDRVIKLNETYQGQTAAQRASGSIAVEKEKTKLRSNPKKWLHEHFTRFYTEWVDDKNIFSQVVARAEAELGHKLAYDYDVHKQAQMALNLASSRALLFLTGGKDTKTTYKVLNTIYGNAITKAVTMKDIMDELNKVSKEDVAKTGADNAYDALGNYLIAMRTEELEKRYHDAYARSAGFDEEGTQEIIKNTPESIRKIAQMYWDINTNVVNILQQQGLISKELAGKLRKYKHYCPMYRDMSDGITDMDEMISSIGMFNNGSGYANINNGIKRIEGGGKRPILDPITSLSQMAVSMISKCERNNVAKTFVKLGQDFAGLGDIVVRDPTLQHADPTAFAFTVWQNGKQVVYRTTPEIYDALTHMDSNSASAVLGIARNIAHTLRTGATISPSFIVRNFLRDTMSATVNSKTGFKPIVDSIRGAWKLHFDKKFSAEYHASGASMSTYMRADADSSRNLTKELLGHKYDSYPVVVKQVRQLIGYAWNKYEKFGNLVEDSTRAGEFMRARKKGMSIDQSGQLARDITLDFSRHGKRGQEVNKYVPFFNATIQGTDKFIRTFKENPLRAILTTAVSIILPSLILWARNHDDDWYKELDYNTKYTNWCINLGNGAHLLIPKPQEVGILFGSGVEAVLNQLTGTDPHGMKEWAKQYAEAVTPSLYPAVVRPLIEWMTNYSFWTGRHLIPTGLEKAPSEMQFTSYTSELAKALGDTWLAKSIKLSPIAIDNWISGWFGSAGRFLANSLNDPISYVKGNSRPTEPAKYWYEMPFVGSFIRQNGQNSEYINRMYEIQKEMNDDYERSDAYQQRKGKKGSSNKPTGLRQVDTAVSSVSKINKEIKAIRNDPKKDPDQKRREIDIRREKINALAKKVVITFDR